MVKSNTDTDYWFLEQAHGWAPAKILLTFEKIESWNIPKQQRIGKVQNQEEWLMVHSCISIS